MRGNANINLPLPPHSKLSKSNPMKNLIAIICLTLTVLLGSAGMSASADFQKGLTAAQSGGYATALREWTPLAKQGDADAQHKLGNIYYNGKGVLKNNKTAMKWWKYAAQQGNADSQNNLGYMIGNGWV
jgi:TPR repeat protein